MGKEDDKDGGQNKSCRNNPGELFEWLPSIAVGKYIVENEGD